jgi:peroxiredoxin
MLAAAGVTLAALFAAPGSARAVKGELAPDFTGTTLDGKKVTLGDLRGKNPVILNFYADFCMPCKKEFPHLKELAEKHAAKGLRVIAVSLDEEKRTASILPNQTKVKFPVIFDPEGSIAAKYSVQALPHTVVLGKDGKVAQVITGLDLELLNKSVNEVLN